ncbi:MAG: wax ester/triacylglycerol synthase family O-acyltransferase [Actinobacteria bacterium]|nr:wax ester/triacylglycerol synthase family O-acyltransferase [Actinomycetota bacterium]
MRETAAGRAVGADAGEPPVERLLPADLMMLWPEDRGWPEDMGAVAILDPPSAGGPPLDLERMRRTVEDRLHLVPRLRQVLHRPPPGRGGPYWADDGAFAVAHHVRCEPLPAGAGEPELLAEVERIRRRPFDPDRPRWEMWLLPGLSGGRAGLYLKLHHAMADGLAGIATVGAFLDVEPDAAPAGAVPWSARPVPGDADLRADARRRRAAVGRELLAEARHPVATARRAVATATGLARVARPRAPRTSLNRPIGSARRLSFVRLDLEEVRSAAHRHGATINDVLLALTAAGLRSLLRQRGEPVEDLVLRAVVPVSMHDEVDGEPSGNRDASMLVPVPLGSCTPGARVEAMASATRRAKRSSFVPPSGVVARSGVAQRLSWRRFDRQRMANAYVADLPGPPMPLHLAGCRLREAFPVVPLVGNVTLGVGALSYAGCLGVAVVSDVDTCPDVERFVDAFVATAAGLAIGVADGG